VRKRDSARLNIVAALAALVGGVVAAVDVIGHPARLVHVITIFFAGMGGGAALVSAVVAARSSRKQADAPSAGTSSAPENGSPSWT
jgi:poly(3-hydroxybutyrate) depolymerase